MRRRRVRQNHATRGRGGMGGPLRTPAMPMSDASVDAVGIWRKHPVKIYLLDHAIGHCQQVRRHVQAKCFRGLEIDGEFKLCGSLYREIIWLLAVQDAIYIRRRSTNNFS